MSHDPEAILLDIEGTTTAIAFVYETLFPYARERLEGFVAERFADPEVQDALSHWTPAARDTPEAAAAHGLELMDRDVKDTGLKALQGLVWRSGYAEGRLHGHVFDDVAPALEAWAAAGVPVYIYSSGSVEAQRLLFGHATAGDLTGLIAGYFDTRTGPKKDADSYRAIARDVGVPPDRIRFVTDHLDEARAAREAGVEAWLSVRPGNPPLPPHGFESLRTLATIAPSPAA